MNIGSKGTSRFQTIDLVPYMMVFTVGITWGVTFSLARIAAEAGAHPIGLAFWQAAGGALVLLPVCLYRKVLPRINWQNCKRYMVIALAGTAVPGTFLFYAASRVPSGILAITVSLVPMLTYVFALILGIDKYANKRFVGIMLGFGAILLLSLPESSLPDPGMVKWMLLALLASVFYTIENIYVDISIPQGTDLVALLAGGLCVAALLLAPIAFSQSAFVTPQYPFTEVEWAIIAMAFVSSTAYALFFYIVKKSGAVFASLVGYVITLAGVFWGMLFFGESHSIWVWAALATMLVGMAMVTPREKPVL
ncbi:MAG: DMT family transporter [Gammaproteobacteria bacterium]|nr:DMT family transporter [Gammaproteobacteria bacterium]